MTKGSKVVGRLHNFKSFFLRALERHRRTFGTAGISASSLALAACGGGSSTSGTTGRENSFADYAAPKKTYEPPRVEDPYYELLKTQYSEPYWVKALEMDQYLTHIPEVLGTSGRSIGFSFPKSQPAYEHFEITGWQAATPQMMAATREILSGLEAVLDVSFEEVEDPNAINVIAVARSDQVASSGLSYFPDNFYELGMDVFISKSFSTPYFVGSFTTNYDYEVLLHEIGHALGLKHPFEADGLNSARLPTIEDQSVSTAMSYNDSPLANSGTFRPLDWMTLTKYYGVNPNHNAGDSVYEFSSLGGVFIIDGGGVDTISAGGASRDVTVDLRPGAHSHLGSKSGYITSANQLTISHGSDIENVKTGSGDDTVIGTALDNLITTGGGDDTIFAGGGTDIIRSGTGSDRIDLSEAVQAVDTVAVDASLFDLWSDTIYGFAQGIGGDVLDLGGILAAGSAFFPLVAAEAAPAANFSGGVLRLVGDALSSTEGMANALNTGGSLSNLTISDGARAIIISAASQSTGEDQSLFYAQGDSEGIQVSQLALLQGAALDIDQWHASNFGLIA